MLLMMANFNGWEILTAAGLFAFSLYGLLASEVAEEVVLEAIIEEVVDEGIENAVEAEL